MTQKDEFRRSKAWGVKEGKIKEREEKRDSQKLEK